MEPTTEWLTGQVEDGLNKLSLTLKQLNRRRNSRPRSISTPSSEIPLSPFQINSSQASFTITITKYAQQLNTPPYNRYVYWIASLMMMVLFQSRRVGLQLSSPFVVVMWPNVNNTLTRNSPSEGSHVDVDMTANLKGQSQLGPHKYWVGFQLGRQRPSSFHYQWTGSERMTLAP